MRQLKPARLGRDGPGEGSAGISEQFAFEQSFRKSRAVDCNKGIVAARADPVDQPGY